MIPKRSRPTTGNSFIAYAIYSLLFLRYRASYEGHFV
jgi:hypothetical protein